MYSVYKMTYTYIYVFEKETKKRAFCLTVKLFTLYFYLCFFFIKCDFVLLAQLNSFAYIRIPCVGERKLKNSGRNL